MENLLAVCSAGRKRDYAFCTEKLLVRNHTKDYSMISYQCQEENKLLFTGNAMMLGVNSKINFMISFKKDSLVKKKITVRI